MQGSTRRGANARRWLGGAAVLLITVLVLSVGVVLGIRGDPGSPTDAGPAGSDPTVSSPTPPPALGTPYTRVDDVSLTLPEEVRAAHGTFFIEGGTSYVATFAVSTVKPPEEPGLGMYLGVTFSCAGEDGGVTEWIGGTENLLRGEPVTYRNQLLLTPEADQVVSCSVRANAPYDDVAAAGATIELDIEWRVAEAGGQAVSSDPEKRLPMTVDRGSRAFAFTEQIELPAHRLQAVTMLSSLHLTTCTVVNGSREDGRTWCAQDDLDEKGSTFDVELRIDVLDANGDACAVLGTKTVTESLRLERHHQLLPLAAEFTVPAQLCGSTLRAAVVVDNRGPASLVVHASNSSLITQWQ